MKGRSMTRTNEEFPNLGPTLAEYTTHVAAEPSAAMPGERLRVVVGDDHPLYRDGIVRSLAAAGMEVVAEAGDGDAALALIREHQPDVALLDVSMPGLDGIDVVEALARRGPAVPVVLLSAFDDEPLMQSGAQAGAVAYINKTADRESIVDSVVVAADTAKSPTTLAGSGDLLPRLPQRWMAHLTLQEHSLMMLARRGLSKQAMARKLGVEEPVVRRSLSSAIAKLGADTLPEAVETAVDAGVLR